MTQAGADWYYAIGAARNGPIDITSLRQLLASGQIHAHTLVWSDGMPNWIAAITHPDLAVAAQQQFHGMPGGSAYNPSSGYAPRGYAPGQPLHYYDPYSSVMYAGFWLRFGAWLLDFLVTNVAGCILGVVIGFFYTISGGASGQGATAGNHLGLKIVCYVIGFTFGWLYYALMESSSAQATLGKMACGIKVTDEQGQRISFARATGRHFAKLISGIILGIGYFMAGWTERNQALHDIMASTLVVKR